MEIKLSFIQRMYNDKGWIYLWGGIKKLLKRGTKVIVVDNKGKRVEAFRKRGF